MPDLESPPEQSRTWANRYLLYDLDGQSRQIFLRIRLLIKEGATEIQTPNPPLYQARQQTEKPLEVPKRGGMEARQFQACFQDLTDPTAPSYRVVYCPYRGGTANVKGLARELMDWPNVLGVEYRGETHNRHYEEFIQ